MEQQTETSVHHLLCQFPIVYSDPKEDLFRFVRMCNQHLEVTSDTTNIVYFKPRQTPHG